MCVIQKQVPLPLPCVNFAQITIPSLTHRRNPFSTIICVLSEGVHNYNCASSCYRQFSYTQRMCPVTRHSLRE